MLIVNRSPGQFVSICLLALSSFLFTTRTWAEISSERQEQLIHLVQHDCGSCHGMTLNGGLGPPLTVQSLQGKSPELLEGIIYHGLAERAMPPWKDLLTQPEIHWLVERLQKGEIP